MSVTVSVAVVLSWLGLAGLTVDALELVTKICRKYSSRG